MKYASTYCEVVRVPAHCFFDTEHGMISAGGLCIASTALTGLSTCSEARRENALGECLRHSQAAVEFEPGIDSRVHRRYTAQHSERGATGVSLSGGMKWFSSFVLS